VDSLAVFLVAEKRDDDDKRTGRTESRNPEEDAKRLPKDFTLFLKR
jgi:hypothetical protein